MDTEQIKQDCIRSLDEKITQGREFYQSYELTEHASYESRLDENEIRRFAITAIHEIERISGNSSIFFSQLPELDETALYHSENSRMKIGMIVGCLSSLRDAIDQGHLGSLESQIRANIHDDILQQAKSLLDSNYYIAAMVLVGGVLENHLQKLCIANSLTWTGDGTITKYNDLLKDEIIPQDKWRRIQSVGDSRNYAAHGEYERVNFDDVQDHQKFVERLIEEFPA